MTHGGGYSYITFKNNFNKWNTPILFARMPPGLRPPPGTKNYYDLIKLGNETGLKEILDGFELNN